MASPGFINRLREHLGSDDFEERIERFLDKHAEEVVKSSETKVSQPPHQPYLLHDIT